MLTTVVFVARYAMLKQGMYMWMTDDKKVPTQDHTDGGIACAMYHPEDQARPERNPRPALCGAHS